VRDYARTRLHEAPLATGWRELTLLDRAVQPGEFTLDLPPRPMAHFTQDLYRGPARTEC
jgi:hypothetical protein